jgi:hypothetical protein
MASLPPSQTAALIRDAIMRRAAFHAALQAMISEVDRASATSEEARRLRERAAAVSAALAMTATSSHDIVDRSSSVRPSANPPSG